MLDDGAYGMAGDGEMRLVEDEFRECFVFHGS